MVTQPALLLQSPGGGSWASVRMGCWLLRAFRRVLVEDKWHVDASRHRRGLQQTGQWQAWHHWPVWSSGQSVVISAWCSLINAVHTCLQEASYQQRTVTHLPGQCHTRPCHGRGPAVPAGRPCYHPWSMLPSCHCSAVSSLSYRPRLLHCLFIVTRHIYTRCTINTPTDDLSYTRVHCDEQ